MKISNFMITIFIIVAVVLAMTSCTKEAVQLSVQKTPVYLVVDSYTNNGDVNNSQVIVVN